MLTALIVDDHVENRELLQIMLRGYGYQVVSANNGAQALERLSERSFDVIISDILMPQMDGFQLCREVKKNELLQSIPFIFYTATYTDPKDEDFALSLGASYFIVKPIEPEPFQEILQKVMQRASISVPPGSDASAEPDEVYLKVYNERLVQKLEHKLEELEAASRDLKAALAAKDHEIVERKAAEEAQKRLQEQLARAQKMEAVGALAGGVAHDLNNMLQVITGYTEIAASDLVPGSLAHENLGQVQRAAKRATDLVRQLLVFSRKSELRLDNLNLNNLIADLTKMISRLIGEHIRIEFDPDTSLRPVYADPGQMEQVIVNLCVNSRDAMPQGGEITIRTRNTRIDPHSPEAYPGAPGGDYVLITVQDTGTGIPEEVKPQIFEPFFTTKELGKGTGLGLATIFAIVNRHKGFVDFTSEEGKGTTFRIVVPASETLAGRRTVPAPRAESAASGVGRTILLAEDDEQVRSFAQFVLEKSNYRVLVARDGDEALKVFDSHADTIDLAFLDVVLPKKTGKTVLEFMRSRKPGLPVLFSSGYSYDILGSGAGSQPLVEVIDKPFERCELLSRIGSMINHTKPSQ